MSWSSSGFLHKQRLSSSNCENLEFGNNVPGSLLWIAFYSSVEDGRYISDFKEVEYTITYKINVLKCFKKLLSYEMQ